MKIMMLVAVAAMGFVSCSNNFEDVNVKNETFELVISAEKPALESDSRTEFVDGSIIWTKSDQIRACYYHNTGVWSKYYASTENTVEDGGSAKATFSGFTAFPAQSEGGTYTFYAGYPKKAIGGDDTAAPDAGELSVELPTEQTMPKAGTFDANADIMLGVAPDVVAAPVTEISVRWNRLVAHGCVTLKNLAAEEGEIVKHVTFTAPEDVKLTGNNSVNFIDEGFVGDFDNNTVTVTLPTNTAAKFTELPVWFCSAPATIAAGANLTIAVETTRGTYTRTITANEKGIKFLQNRYNTLGINMASATFTAHAVSANVYKQITSKAELTTGEYVLAALYNGTYYAIPTPLTLSSGKITTLTTMTVVDGEITEIDAKGHVLTLTANGNNVSVFDGVNYITYKSGTDFKLQTDAATWAVDYDSNMFQFTSTRYFLFYWNGGAPRFGAYATSNWGGDNYSGLYLFKKTVNDPNAPRLSVDKSALTFAVEGGKQTVTATTNYDGAITALSDNDHFSVSVSGKVVTVTAPANEESTEQTATITITAGDLSKSVTVTQEENISAMAGTGEGTEASPYDVTRAYAVIDALATDAKAEGVYVKGIVTEDAISFSSQYGNSDYYISNDGTTTNKLQVFRGKYLDNVAFTSADQIHAGDEVVIYGNLKKHYETYEFDSGNYIVSLNCPHGENSTEQTVTFDYKPATVTVGKTATVVATAKTTVTYSSNNTAVATIDAKTGVITGVAEGTVTITATAAAEGIYKQATATFELTVEAAQEGGTVTLGESYTYEFSSKVFAALGETKALGSLNWTVNGTGSTYFGGMDNNNGRGLQFGSKNSPFTSLSLTTTEYQGGVQTIKINTSGASGIVAKFTVTVGGVVIGSAQSLTTSAKEYTLTSTEMLSGDIVISYTATTGKAIYIKSISIN